MKIDGSPATTIIEKVVNEELNKLATEQHSHDLESPIVKVDVIKQPPKIPDNFDKILMVDLKTGERVWINSPFELQFLRGLVTVEKYESLKKTDELSSTESPVISVDIITRVDEPQKSISNIVDNKPTTVKEQEHLIATENPIDKKISTNLLTAVEDLLSSILDVNVNLKNKLEDKNNNTDDSELNSEETPEVLNNTDSSVEKVLNEDSMNLLETEQGTEKSDTVTSVDYEGEEKSAEIIDSITTAVSEAQITTKSQGKSEIDLKIENLSTEQTNFMTESSPEVFTEKFVEIPVTLVADEKYNLNHKSKPIVLEVIAELSSENDKKNNLSFEYSISQVINNH